MPTPLPTHLLNGHLRRTLYLAAIFHLGIFDALERVGHLAAGQHPWVAWLTATCADDCDGSEWPRRLFVYVVTMVLTSELTHQALLSVYHACGRLRLRLARFNSRSRSVQDLEIHIKDGLAHSTRIHILVLSVPIVAWNPHTSFVLRELVSQASARQFAAGRREFRIKILDPTSTEGITHAQWFERDARYRLEMALAKGAMPATTFDTAFIDAAAYTRVSSVAISKLPAQVKQHIELYTKRPRWRMMIIFDDEAYVSRNGTRLEREQRIDMISRHKTDIFETLCEEFQGHS